MPETWTQRSFTDPLVPAAQVGVVSGVAGVTAGSVYGLFNSEHPRVFATASGFSAGLYGFGIYYFRGAILAAQNQERTRKSELVASGTAGAVTGALLGATHLRIINVLRSSTGATLAAIVLQAGQHRLVDVYRRPRQQSSWMDWVAKWTPLRKMEEAEYEKLLTEKINLLDNQLATLDGKLDKLRREKESLQNTEP